MRLRMPSVTRSERGRRGVRASCLCGVAQGRPRPSLPGNFRSFKGSDMTQQVLSQINCKAKYVQIHPNTLYYKSSALWIWEDTMPSFTGLAPATDGNELSVSAALSFPTSHLHVPLRKIETLRGWYMSHLPCCSCACPRFVGASEMLERNLRISAVGSYQLP